MEPPSDTAPRLRWSGLSDRGKVRANNEDAFLGVQFDAREAQLLGKLGEASLENAALAFAVSDGMGGQNAGEFASRITVEKITRLLPHAFKQTASGLVIYHDDVLEELFTQIHRAICHLSDSYEECSGMGATLSLCWFTPGWMYYAHVGDSRIYHLPATGGMKQLTEDDTYVGWLVRNGSLSEYEARNHPARNRLQKALGGGSQFLDPQLGAVTFEKGDTFLLCTDGVMDGLFDIAIADCIRTPSAIDPAQRLVRAAVENSGRDNTTAIVVEVL